MSNLHLSAKRLERGFCPLEFFELFKSDPMSRQGRYDDINGRDIGSVMSKVGWLFADTPVTVGIMSGGNTAVAVGFAAPIVLDDSPGRPGNFDGINLSYAVHSAHEGHGYGLAAACLALQDAQAMWGEGLEGAFLSIQTRAANARSNALVGALGGELCEESSFVAMLANGNRLDYSGFRLPWETALRRAEAIVRGLSFLEHTNVLAQESPEPAPG